MLPEILPEKLSEQLPEIPGLCNICLQPNSDQIIPNRDESLPWIFQIFCPTCVENFLSIPPFHFKKIRDRQIYGKLQK